MMVLYVYGSDIVKWIERYLVSERDNDEEWINAIRVSKCAFLVRKN
jgi:hypothetical protein